jgi:hypothetical protein
MGGRLLHRFEAIGSSPVFVMVHLSRVRIKPLIRPAFLSCLSAHFLRSSSQGRLLIAHIRPSDHRPVYMSLPEDENKTIDTERLDLEHVGKVDVSWFSSLLSLMHRFEIINSAMYRASLSVTTMIQTSIPRRRYSSMNLHIQRSGLQSPTQTIPRWLHRPFELGSSVSFSLSLFPVSISSFTSDPLPLRFYRLVFDRR